MYYPYCVIGDTVNVSHTPVNDKGIVVVNFEKPDAIFGFKTLDCTIPNYRVSNIVGFSESEVSDLVGFCQQNASLILNAAAQGGVKNAEYL